MGCGSSIIGDEKQTKVVEKNVRREQVEILISYPATKVGTVLPFSLATSEALSKVWHVCAIFLSAIALSRPHHLVLLISGLKS